MNITTPTFQHLHATQTASVYRPSAADDDEGVETPAATGDATFTLLVSIAEDRDAIDRNAYGDDVEEIVKVLSKDRTNLLQPKDIIEIDMPDGRSNVRFEVGIVNSALVQTQQARAIRRASSGSRGTGKL